MLVVALVAGARLYFGGSAALTTAPDDAEARTADAMLAQLAPPPASEDVSLPDGAAPAALRDAAPPLPRHARIAEQEGVVLTGHPFTDAGAATGTFTRIDGTQLGFEHLPTPPPYETAVLSANEFAPLAAGDVNDDGWPDVAVGTAHGAFVYVNTGGEFALQEVDFAQMRDWTVTYVALVDLDGDDAHDLFLCGWLQGCHILFNRGGEFSDAAHTELPRAEELATHSAAFADIDRDGDLDIVTGPAVGLGWKFAPFGKVRVWFADGDGAFEPEALPGPPGETLSLLFVDVDDDGWLDLYVGNDFDEPDLVYRNDAGRLELLTKDANPFPHTTESTMSVDSGDIDNDGALEVYQAAIAYGGVGMDAVERPRISPHDSCRLAFEDSDVVRSCLELGDFQTAVVRSRDITDVQECTHFAEDEPRRQCIAAGYLWNEAFVDVPEQGGTPEAVADVCRKMPQHLAKLRDICAVVPQASIDHGQSYKVHVEHVPQIRDWNVLFAPGENGYGEVTEQWGAAFGGWSWNAKFADIDNDSWQDLYVTQGTRLRFSNVTNLLYHNDGGGSFTERTSDFGLDHFVPTGASLYVDYNLDGRLDIISYPFALTPTVWRNDLETGPALQIALHDPTSANRDAVGARVEIRSSDDRLQVREIKASGGFESDDWKVAWFGLGDWPAVASITVTWPDGESTTLQLEDGLEPGRYTLERSGS